MTAYLIRRILLLPVVLFIVVTLIFFVIRVGPTNPVDAATALVTDPQVKEQIRHEFGVDQPIYVNYARFLGGVLHGDFGRSFFSHRPVLDVILERLPATIELALAGLLIGAVLGIGLGILSALNAGSAVDTACRVIAVSWLSMPIFWLGLLFIALLTVKLGWLPATGRFDPRADIPTPTHFYLIDSLLTGDPTYVVTALKYLAMPAAVLGLSISGFLLRLTRNTLLDALRQDYVRTARSKGLREHLVVRRHALRNAILPVVTLIGLLFGGLLGGAAVIETVFAWPGLGLLMVDSINTRDYPQIQGSIGVFAAGYVVVNLIVDFLYVFIDPRIQYGKAS
jgi:peptide/nickel transport system permease protein